MDNSIHDHLESLFIKTREYAETNIELNKLKAVDKSSDILSTIISKMIVLLVFIIFIVIVNIGIALLLGEYLGRSFYGFFVLAGFYLIAGFIFISMRKKWFKEPITNMIIQKFLK